MTTSNLSPLAQTFKVPDTYTKGMYVTSIDLFFAYVAPGEREPIEVHLVQTSNGYPTELIIEDSKVILPSSRISSSATSLVPTKFKFEHPIFLEGGKEYAFKVLSNSMRYKVWTSVMGRTRVDNPAALITQQPATGSLFKSQNNSTWTAEQLQDLTFRLNRAKFNTSVIGNLRLVEAPINNYDTLPANPFRLTNGFTKVKVHHPSHGLAAGMYVRYSGSNDAQFNNVTFVVDSVVNNDYYIINTSTAQTITENVGGSAVISESSIKYDTIAVYGLREGRDTGTRVSIKMASPTAVDSSFTDVNVNDITDMAVNKFIHSSLNRSSLLHGAPSFTVDVKLSSIDDALSPMIDLSELSIDLISNKINNPTSADVDYDIDGITIVTGSANVSFAATGNIITIPSTTDYSQIKEGAWIKITAGTNANKTGYIGSVDPAANTIVMVGDALVDATNETTNIIQYNSFISETSNHGTAESKHITKVVNLVNKSSGFRVTFQANIHKDAELEMYYRTGLQGDLIKISETSWTKHLISYKKTASETEFTEYSYDITGLESFDEFQFKFVFLSSNTAVSPKMKNLRIIAHA